MTITAAGRFVFDVRYTWFRNWVNGPAGQRLGLAPIPASPVNLRALPARAAPVKAAVLQLCGWNRRSEGSPTLARAFGIGVSDGGRSPVRVPIWPHILPSLRA